MSYFYYFLAFFLQYFHCFFNMRAKCCCGLHSGILLSLYLQDLCACGHRECDRSIITVSASFQRCCLFDYLTEAIFPENVVVRLLASASWHSQCRQTSQSCQLHLTQSSWIHQLQKFLFVIHIFFYAVAMITNSWSHQRLPMITAANKKSLHSQRAIARWLTVTNTAVCG